MDFVAAAVLANAGTFAGAIAASAVVAGVVAGLVSRSARRDVVHASGSAAVPASGDGATVTRAQAVPAAKEGMAVGPPGAPGPTSDALEAELRERRAEIARIEERMLAKEEAIEARANELGRRETLARGPDAQPRERSRSSSRRRKQDQLRELERIADLSAGTGAPAAAARARVRAAPRQRQARPPGRGGDAPRRRPPRAQHPLGVYAAPGRRPRDGDDGVGRRAPVRRPEGPHHRPRGSQHPRPRDAHRASTSSSTTPRARSCCPASTACAARSPG